MAAVTQESRDTADGGDTDSGHVMNFSIGKVLLQQADHLPAIRERLEFCRRT